MTRWYVAFRRRVTDSPTETQVEYQVVRVRAWKSWKAVSKARRRMSGWALVDYRTCVEELELRS